MKVYILDKRGFLEQVQNSKGDVYLILPDETPCNLKKDALARQLFMVMDIPKTGLDFTFSNPVDTVSFLSFLVGMEAKKRCA